MPFQRKSQQVVLWWSRLSFPCVWTPKPVRIHGREVSAPRFSTLIVVADAMIQKVREIEDQLIAESWPEGIPQGVKVTRALRPGEVARPGDPNLAGKMILSANAKADSPPGIVMKDPATGLYHPVTDHSKIYSGAEAHVHVGLFTTQMKITEPQIDVGLNMLEPTGRSFSRFDGRPTAESAFGAGPPDNAPPPPAEEGQTPPPATEQPATEYQQQAAVPEGADEELPW